MKNHLRRVTPRAAVCVAVLIGASSCSQFAASIRADLYSAPPRGIMTDPPAVPAGAPSATVIVYRDNAFAGAAIDSWLGFDKKVIASLQPLQRVEFHVSPGRHEVAMHCFSFGKWYFEAVPIDAVAGKSYYVLMSSKLKECAQLNSIGDDAAAQWTRRTQLVATGP